MYRIYQIENETSLEEIANKFNTTADNLKKINGINNNYYIQRGNYIIVPLLENENFETYKVKQGDSMYAIAQKYNVNYNDLLDLNGLDKDEYIYPNQEILIPKPGVNFIVTKENETLADISNKLDMTQDEIIRQNSTIYLMPDQLIIYKKRD